MIPRTDCGSGCCGRMWKPRWSTLHHTSTTVSLVEAGQRAAGVGQVDRQRGAGVVVVGAHHVDRQLELVDATAGPGRVELRRGRVGLLP